MESVLQARLQRCTIRCQDQAQVVQTCSSCHAHTGYCLPLETACFTYLCCSQERLPAQPSQGQIAEAQVMLWLGNDLCVG